MLAIPADDDAEHVSTRLALLCGELVKPFDVFIRQVCEDASHDDILISYHDIMSRFCSLTVAWLWIEHDSTRLHSDM